LGRPFGTARYKEQRLSLRSAQITGGKGHVHWKKDKVTGNKKKCPPSSIVRSLKGTLEEANTGKQRGSRRKRGERRQVLFAGEKWDFSKGGVFR